MAERGLDFLDFPKLFDAVYIAAVDNRYDYGEERWMVYGFLDGQLVHACWTHRGEAYRVISMRKANKREEAHFKTKTAHVTR